MPDKSLTKVLAVKDLRKDYGLLRAVAGISIDP
jgi:hypothetical protein